MTATFSGGSQKLQQASDAVHEKVLWTLNMVGEALNEVDNLVAEAGRIGSNVYIINNLRIEIQAINTEIHQGLRGRLVTLKQHIDAAK